MRARARKTLASEVASHTLDPSAVLCSLQQWEERVLCPAPLLPALVCCLVKAHLSGSHRVGAAAADTVRRPCPSHLSCLGRRRARTCLCVCVWCSVVQCAKYLGEGVIRRQAYLTPLILPYPVCVLGSEKLHLCTSSCNAHKQKRCVCVSHLRCCVRLLDDELAA